jgi:glutamate dehydrogenase
MTAHTSPSNRAEQPMTTATRVSGQYAAPTAADLERLGRRERFVQIVQGSEFFADASAQRRALYVADAVIRRADGEFVSRHPVEQFPGHIGHTLKAVAKREPHEILTGCYRPRKDTTGYELPVFVLETCMADQPFIVDTIKMALRKLDVHVLGTLNMILPVERDDQGHFRDIGTESPLARPESFSCHLLSAASVGDHGDDIDTTVRWHLERAQRIAADFRTMRRLLRDVGSTLTHLAEEQGGDLAVSCREAVHFCEWLADDNFVFMGAYGFDMDLRPTGRLGLGRFDHADKAGVEGEPKQAFAGDAPLVSIHQSSIAAPVHREAPLVEIRIRQFDPDGQPAGGVVLQGLFTYKAVMGRASTVPFLRHRLTKMVASEDLVPASHRMKVFLSFFDRLPLHFMFSASDQAIVQLVNEAIDVDFGGSPRVYYRIDPLGTGAQVFVMLSQERYGDELRRDLEDHLKSVFGARHVGFRLLVGKTDTVLLDFLLFADQPLQRPDADTLDETVAAMVEPWSERMRDLLRACELPESEVDRLCLLYGEALPEGYPQRLDAAHLLEDLRAFDAVRHDKKVRIRLRQDAADQRDGVTRLLVYTPVDIALTDIMPILDQFGLRVLGESTEPIVDAENRTQYFEQYRIAADAGAGPDLADHGDAFIEALHAVLEGRINPSPLNRLLLPARLSWRQLLALRAYLAFARQLGTVFATSLVQQVLLNQPQLARTLMELFHARFALTLDGKPGTLVGGRDPKRLANVAAVQAKFAEQLRTVQDATEDKVLRMFANFVMATMRTNFFQRPDEVRALSFKFRCQDVELMPEPRPMFEIFVYAPDVEGVHLRGGRIARGGIRWSDRIDDFRTEVLGLMQTQMVKNTLIVPVGSKGGFVLKKPARDDQARRKQADELYEVFINGLLDVTDNLVQGKPVYPDDVIAYDEGDPYLVVAADKGTAHLSDTANAISLRRGFWLGDAFASGGSQGYDHKLYGITAKGGWVCVQRHFREMGVDTQADRFTCTGIGDMSGDVFGNGLLLTKTLQLVAAFDHRHIIVDPNPDPERSWHERKRLFDLPRSNWSLYDKAVLSEGGGVFPRTAKSIPLSPQMQRLFKTERTEMAGDEMMREILLLDVDLFWNGGIGTFVKASHETNADVGDRSNDAIRVDATQLNCKVVGEGGNLGFTQAARVEFALRGGRINTDAVDNSAGVDLSDHEVNLKILYAPLLQARKITMDQRNSVLTAIDNYVCDLVTFNNDQQSLGLSVAEAQSAAHIRDWGDVIRHLVGQLKIDQAVQLLPSKVTVAERRKAGLGLTRPELARITAFAKMWVYNALVEDPKSSALVAKRYLDHYFPERVRASYGDAIERHMLRHEIVCTLWVNQLVDYGSALLLPQLHLEYTRPVAELCQAHTCSLDLLSVPELRRRIAEAKLPAKVQYEALNLLEDAATDATRWLLATFPGETLKGVIAEADAIARWSQGLGDVMAGAYHGRQRTEVAQACARWEQSGMPHDLGRAIASAAAMGHVFAVWQLAREANLEQTQAVAIYFACAQVTGLYEVLAQIGDATPQNRWEAMALHSLGQGMAYTLYRLAVRVAQTLGGKRAPTVDSVRAVLVDELKLGPLWDLANQIQAEAVVQIPALVVLTERLRARLR